MNVSKVFSILSKLPRTSLAINRNVSEYAKRMGYKIIEDPPQSRDYLTSALYSIGAVVLLLGIANDKQKHYEVFTKHCDERKYHFDNEIYISNVVVPNMDFFFNELRDQKNAESDS